MKIKISLLLASLVIMGMAKPIDAEITKSASPAQTSPRVKNLETLLRNSGLCKHYPIVVKILNDNTVQIATYADRRLSDKEIKILALNIARLISTNIDKIMEVKVRLYDPASTKYWKDIVLNAIQIQDGLKPGPEQGQILNSIKILNNLGLVDGPNLETRVDVYKHILILKQTGIAVQPYLLKLAQIEKTEKNKQNISTQLTELNNSLLAAESEINKPISSNTSNKNEIESSLKQSWQEARDNEAAALKTVEDLEQEQTDMMLPEAYDSDAQERYQDHYEGLQTKIDAALAAWHEAVRYRELAYQQLEQAKEHY